MRLNVRHYMFVGLLQVSSTLYAQTDSGAVDFFTTRENCTTSFGGWKCLELDLSSELVEESDSTKVYKYSWNFGDGTRKQGTRTEHCYEDFGQYQIALDLIDVETNTVIRNELSSTIFLYPEIFPSIDFTTDGVPPSFMKFSCRYGDVGFVPDHIYWRINGDYYEGETIMHTFPVAGDYLIEVGLIKDMEFLGTVTACASREIKVEASNVWTTALLKKIDELRIEEKSGPYASSDVVCLIKESLADKHQSFLIPLQSLMGEIKLKDNAVYEISLLAGNLISEKTSMSTEGISGNDLYLALRDAILGLKDQPFTALNALRFEKNKVTLPADGLQLSRAVNILQRHPDVHVQIGSYVHTGSRLGRSISMSLMRANAVKDALVKNGISADRISVASPENNRALINTCSALPDCDWENPALNGVVELKITGAKL